MSIMENTVSCSNGQWDAHKEVKVLFVTRSSLYAAGLQLLIAQNMAEAKLKICIDQSNTAQHLLKLDAQQELAAYLDHNGFQLFLISAQPNFEEAYQVALVLHQASPEGKIIWLDIPEDLQKIVRSIETGATGFFLENEEPDYFCHSLIQAFEGEIVCSPKTLSHVFQGLAERKVSPDLAIARTSDITLVTLPKLTQRELQVMQIMTRGLSNREISEQLTVELRTVKNHVHNILEKLQVSNRRDAVLKAIQLQLLRKD